MTPLKKTTLSTLLGLLLTNLLPTHQLLAQSAANPLSTQLALKDSLLFDIAFHTCEIKNLPALLTKDFVFYHDGSYTNPTSDQGYQNFVETLQNSCQQLGQAESPKMRREIRKGSLQVFQLNGYEAMQTGIQRFYLKQNGQKEKIVEESKFSRTWKLEAGQWRMARELDYEVKTQFSDDSATVQRFQPDPYIPVSKQLYDTVAHMDSIYFDTYNTCNLEKMAALMADTMEFYHDKGGLMTSKKDFMEAIQHNICGKVSRQLVPGSIEVYPINNYGAVLIGYHRFFNHAEPTSGWSKPDKYIAIWRNCNGRWQLTRVVSLH